MDFDDCSDRKLLKHYGLDLVHDYHGNPVAQNENIVEVKTLPEANLISSECSDGLHAPVIDFDYPIEVYPSSQLGHCHLYINKKITWTDYTILLTDLKLAGMIEPGYADASIAKGFSSVRPVGVVKLNAPKGVDILKQNAQLRQVNFKLSQERDYLLKKVQEYEQAAQQTSS